jgi:hypothetical protein
MVVPLFMSSILLKIKVQKHTNVKTIYNQYLKIHYIQKILKMPSGRGWVGRLRINK